MRSIIPATLLSFLEFLRYVHICMRMWIRHAGLRWTQQISKSGLFGVRLVKRSLGIANVFFFEVPTPNGEHSAVHWKFAAQTNTVHSTSATHPRQHFSHFCMPHSAFAYRCGRSFTLHWWPPHFFHLNNTCSLWKQTTDHSLYHCVVHHLSMPKLRMKLFSHNFEWTWMEKMFKNKTGFCADKSIRSSTSVFTHILTTLLPFLSKFVVHFYEGAVLPRL